MKNWQVTTLISSLFLLVSCNYQRSKVVDDPSANTNPSRFALIQKNIIEPKCLQCHSASHAADGVDLSSYSAIMQSQVIVAGKPSLSRFYTSVASGAMPRGSGALSSGELELIQKWIESGAPELEVASTTPTPTPTVTPTVEAQATYAWISKNIIERKCVVCHNTAKPRGKVDLSSYEALMASTGNKTKPVTAGNAAGSTFYMELEEQKMPPNIKKLTPEEVKAMYDWIKSGAEAPSLVLNPTPSPTPAPSPTPTSPEPTYAWLSKNVFSRRCGSCHGIPYKVAKIDFTSYETLLNSTGTDGKALVPFDPEHSTIYNEVISGHMPPAKKAMTEEEIHIVKQWINDGALNN